MLRKFPLGQVVATPGALDALASSHQTPEQLISRHHAGDWGELGDHDRLENDRALKHNGRPLSSYRLNGGAKIWIITEADRSSTTILLPEEC